MKWSFRRRNRGGNHSALCFANPFPAGTQEFAPTPDAYNRKNVHLDLFEPRTLSMTSEETQGLYQDCGKIAGTATTSTLFLPPHDF